LLFPILLLNIGALVVIWHFRAPNRWRKIAAVVMLILSVIGFIHHIAMSLFTSRYDLGVMIRQEEQLKESPSSDATAGLPVFEGYDVRIDRSQAAAGWVHVTLINGSKGWLPANAVRTYPSKARP
jgi:hypothetical protein